MATGNINRVAFSPGEFAALFGKSQTWGYRQIYAGKVKPVTEYGRLLIPAAEVDRILGTAGLYDGKKSKTKRTKADFKKLQPNLGDAWQRYLAARGEKPVSDGQEILKALRAKRRPVPVLRDNAVQRLAKRGGKEKSR